MFKFLPMGGIPPWMMPMQEQPAQKSPDMMVPPRVLQAMEFIAMMTSKTQSRPAISENQIELIEGQKLTDEEAGALATANNMIARYFAGQLKLDVWEQIRYNNINNKTQSETTPQRIINCVACNPNLPPSSKCPLCSGSGKLLVQPCGAQENPSNGLIDLLMNMVPPPSPSETNDGDSPDKPETTDN